MNAPTTPSTDFPLRGWLTSVLFWLAVFAAAGMYALVTLSPKLLAWQAEQAKWRANQERLVRLERQVGYLKQVATALESDPEFAGELARVELNATRPGDERLPVDQRLSLATDAESHADPRVSQRKLGTLSAFGHQFAYEPFLRQFAEDAARRRWTLLAAAGLVVFAFTFLQSSPARDSESTDDSDDGSWWGRRYNRKRRAA